MSDIVQALHLVRQQIYTAATRFQRDPAAIKLLAVSKTRGIEDILTALHAGQCDFGENYLQEALPKIHALSIHKQLVWHFIGAVQGNKTKAIAENFAWLHSLDNIGHAQRLHRQRPESLPALNVCIQVNVSAEPQKSGIDLTELSDFAYALLKLPRLRLRGLMTLPAPSEDFEIQRQPLHRLFEAYQHLQTLGFQLDTLSMGMTDDLVAAIAEGSTCVRIGTGIFGARG
jgi:pyridoxal phosphate enzyme (YggS family)